MATFEDFSSILSIKGMKYIYREREKPSLKLAPTSFRLQSAVYIHIYQDSKLLSPVACFAELVETCLWAIWAEQFIHRTLDFWPDQPRRNQMYQTERVTSSDESEPSWRIFSSARLVTFLTSARNWKLTEKRAEISILSWRPIFFIIFYNKID